MKNPLLIPMNAALRPVRVRQSVLLSRRSYKPNWRVNPRTNAAADTFEKPDTLDPACAPEGAIVAW